MQYYCSRNMRLRKVKRILLVLVKPEEKPYERSCTLKSRRSREYEHNVNTQRRRSGCDLRILNTICLTRFRDN